MKKKLFSFIFFCPGEMKLFGYEIGIKLPELTPMNVLFFFIFLFFLINYLKAYFPSSREHGILTKIINEDVCSDKLKSAEYKGYIDCDGFEDKVKIPAYLDAFGNLITSAFFSLYEKIIEPYNGWVFQWFFVPFILIIIIIQVRKYKEKTYTIDRLLILSQSNTLQFAEEVNPQIALFMRQQQQQQQRHITNPNPNRSPAHIEELE